MVASPSPSAQDPAAVTAPGAAPGNGDPDCSVVMSGETLLHWRRRLLRYGGGDAAALDWLLDLQGGLRWRELQRLLLSPAQAVTLAAPLQTIETTWRRHRQTGEPLQYLLGRCPWRDLELRVEPGALIPRQETELLVELAFERVAGHDRAPALWADLGTGSGCLAAALARGWPTSRGCAVDRSEQALGIAHRNLEELGLLGRVTLSLGDWWTPLQPLWGTLELVVANPPYIPDAVWLGLEPVVRDHEPRIALSSGADGLDAIRAIAAGAAEALAPGGWLLLEHHHDQSAAVLELLREGGLDQASAHRDLEGKDRFASACRGR